MFEQDKHFIEEEGDVNPAYDGINAPSFMPPEAVYSPYDEGDDYYQGYVPKEFEVADNLRPESDEPAQNSDEDLTLEEPQLEHLDIDQPSEDSRDMWRPRTVTPVNHRPPVRVPRKLFEMPGKNRGRSNFSPPTRKEVLKGMTPEDIKEQQIINKTGAAMAQAALSQR